MKTDNPHKITLKNGQLKPNKLTITLTPTQPEQSLTLSICNTNLQSSSSSLAQNNRKYIFYFQELDEQTEAMSIGDEHIFTNLYLLKSGIYKLCCINYPKIDCDVEIINEQLICVGNQRKSNTIINLSGLESVEEKDQENKEDFGKEDNQWVKSQEELSDNPLGTPEKAQISDFDRMLTRQPDRQQSKQNRYLRYFQQQFQIWRNFFTDPTSQPQPESTVISTPTKQKPKSQHRKKSEDIQTNKDKNKNKDKDKELDLSAETWQKQKQKQRQRQKQKQFYSPDIKYTLSCGSPQNCVDNQYYKESFSQVGVHCDGDGDGRVNDDGQDKDKSVISLLVNSQGGGRDEQFQKQGKTMKKTNSEYRLTIQNQPQKQKQKKHSQADTASKHKSKSKQTSSSKVIKTQTTSFLQWLDQQVQNMNNKYKNEDHEGQQQQEHQNESENQQEQGNGDGDGYGHKYEAEGILKLRIRQKSDEHIIKQWLGHLQNKHKIMRFIYG